MRLDSKAVNLYHKDKKYRLAFLIGAFLITSSWAMGTSFDQKRIRLNLFC